MEEVSNLYIISDFTYAAKNENLTFREFRDVIGANSFVYLLHMSILRKIYTITRNLNTYLYNRQFPGSFTAPCIRDRTNLK